MAVAFAASECRRAGYWVVFETEEGAWIIEVYELSIGAGWDASFRDRLERAGFELRSEQIFMSKHGTWPAALVAVGYLNETDASTG
jgi:hypothetical protein